MTQFFSKSSTAKTTQLEGDSLKLKDLTVNKFSNNNNLTNDEQSVPTEKAVKNYVDGAITDIKATLVNKADTTEVKSEINALSTELKAYFNQEVTDIKTTLANKADSTEVKSEINALSTELKAYFNQEITDVKAILANKAALNGNSEENFNAKNLNVETSIYSKVVATETINSQTVASVKAVSNGFYQVSSRVLKEEINDLSSQDVTEILRSLNPVKFTYTEDESKTPFAGFIAEDTPDLLTSNDKQAIKVVDLVAVLTKIMQDNQKTLHNLVKLTKQQQSEITALKEIVQNLERQRSGMENP
ncbi:tail fiber domain-containing protein [Crinalium epipsammum]|uniref:tail fiber domain-containing protein n=1 Tax=Crinalium epipsammum TaxID=241425 RepID=UPI0018DDBADD|nr:tail fiber domain-containing protein [Crinalium epipsammum]